MNLTSVLLGILIIAAGCLFAFGKGHIYLTAWKTMPQEEKRKIKIQPLCRNIGTMIVLSGMMFLLKGVWSGFDNQWFVVSMIAWFILAGFDVWYITKGNRYYSR
jgi:uncharacterized membrane protein SirB2